MTVERIVRCDVCGERIDGRYVELKLTDTQSSEAIVLAARTERDDRPCHVHPACLPAAKW